MIWLQGIGSVASIVGLLLTIHVWLREMTIEKEVLDLTAEEKKRHDGK